MKIYKDKVLFYSMKNDYRGGVVASQKSNYIAFLSGIIRVDVESGLLYLPCKTKLDTFQGKHFRNYYWVEKSEDT